MALHTLTHEELQELRADLEPQLGQAIEVDTDNRDDLEDAIRAALHSLEGDLAPELEELLELYEVDGDDLQGPAPLAFIEEPTPEMFDDLAAAAAEENYNGTGKALNALLDSPVPAGKADRLMLAARVLEAAENSGVSSDDSAQQPEGPVETVSAQADGADAAEAESGAQDGEASELETRAPRIYQLFCRVTFPGLLERDIVVEPEDEVRHKFEQSWPHATLPDLEAARARIKAGHGRMNHKHSNIKRAEELEAARAEELEGQE